MKRGKRIAAGYLAVSMAFLQLAEPAFAATPKMEVDETLYVNLGYYGEIEKINVVKGYEMNGETEIEDYGTYDKITNMTNTLLPKQEGEKVIWNLEEQTDSFFYQASMKPDSFELPWNLDITYRLNGKIARPEEIGGASGIIGITIKAEPNEQARDYYKNNMILAIIVPVDSSVCYSVDAPGAQFQSLGTLSAAVFSILPGEEKEFQVSLGSENFSFAGVVGMMMPGTINSLEYLQDLNEVRDTWKEEGDAMYQSIHELLLQIESTKGELLELQSGVSALDEARETLEGSKGGIRAKGEQALGDLDSLAEQMDYLIPHLETGQRLLEDVHAGMQDISDSLVDVQDDMDMLYTRIQKTQEHMEELYRLVVSHGPDTGKIVDAAEKAESCLQELEEILETLQGKQRTVKKHTQKVGDARRKYDKEYASMSLVSVASGSNAEVWDEVWEPMESSFSDWMENREELSEIGELTEQLEEVWGSMLEKGNAWVRQIHTILDLMKDSTALQSQMQQVGKDGDRLLSGTRRILDDGVLLIDGAIGLSDTLDAYYPKLQEGMDDVREMASRASNTMDSTNSLLHDVRAVMQTTGDQMNVGAKESMKATAGILGKGVGMLDQVGAVREASEQIKSVMDEKSDKLENESSLLRIDSNAEKLSFTSDQNREPRSIQIMVRTEEISASEKNTAVSVDMETTTSETGLKRMWNVFVRMWEAIVSIFRER